jgi:hypothetical protein
VKDVGFEFGYGDKIAPRIGATYDLLGNGKVKLYGDWGRYFATVPNSLARGAFGADYWHVYYRALDSPDVFALSSLIPNVAATNGTNLPGKNLWSDVSGSSRDRRQLDFDTIAPGIKPMSTDQMNAGAEIQLSPTMVLRAGYVRNSLRTTIEDQGALKNGDEVYFYGNPGEGATSITPTSGLTKPFPTPLLPGLVGKRELCLQPPQRQLSGPVQYGRGSYTDSWCHLWQPAEPDWHRGPERRRRFARMGSGRDSMGFARQTGCPGTARNRPPERTEALRLLYLQVGDRNWR